MSVAPGTRPAVEPGDDVVSVENVTRYWHGAAPAFDQALDPDTAGLGRSAGENRAWELHFCRVTGPPPRRVLDVGTGAGSLSLLSYRGRAGAAIQQVREIPGSERLTALREGRIIPGEGPASIGGIRPIEALDDMAEPLAGFP